MKRHRSDNRLIDALGWCGAILILLAYLLVSQGLVSPHDASYQAMNGTGALGLGVEAWHKRDYPPIFLNLFWIAIALFTTASPHLL